MLLTQRRIISGIALNATAPHSKGDGINATKDQPVNPRNHTDTKEMAKLSASDVENVIRDGGAATSKSTMMPPFGKTMTDAEIKELIGIFEQAL